MSDERKRDDWAAAVIILMLLLTALGNAWLMVAAAAVGLVVGIILLRRGRLSRGAIQIILIGVVVGLLTAGVAHFLVRR